MCNHYVPKNVAGAIELAKKAAELGVPWEVRPDAWPKWPGAGT